MTANLIRDYRRLKQLRAEHRRLVSKIHNLETRAEKLQQRIETVEGVTEIYLGVPICIHPSNYVAPYRGTLHLKGVDKNPRYAEVYRKQNQKRAWGMIYRIFPGYEYGDNINYPNRNTALLAAKNFIAQGIEPKEKP